MSDLGPGCTHGGNGITCPECEGLCPHGWLLEECEVCEWNPESFEVAIRSPELFEEDDRELSDEAFSRLWAWIERAEELPRAEEELRVAIHAELVERRRERQRLVLALEDALRGHGLPLHWQVLQRMVVDKLGRRVSGQETYLTLSRYGDRFDSLGDGVYGLSGSSRREDS